MSKNEKEIQITDDETLTDLYGMLSELPLRDMIAFLGHQKLYENTEKSGTKIAVEETAQKTIDSAKEIMKNGKITNPTQIFEAQIYINHFEKYLNFLIGMNVDVEDNKKKLLGIPNAKKKIQDAGRPN